MNKKHWNTVTVDGSVSGKLIRNGSTVSYELVVDSLPTKVKAELRK